LRSAGSRVLQRDRNECPSLTTTGRNQIESLANVPFTTYLVLGLLWSVEGLLEGRKGATVIGGLLWGLACWTRAEGILFVGVLATLLFLLAGPRGVPWRTVLSWLLPVAVIATSWFLFSVSSVLQSHLWEAVSTYAGGLGVEDAHKYQAYLMAKSIWLDSIYVGEHRTVWGTAAIAVGLSLLFSVRRVFRSPQKHELAVLLGGMLAGGLTLSMFYIRSYSKPDFVAVVQRSMPRALFPGAVLLVLSAILMTAARPNRSDRDEA